MPSTFSIMIYTTLFLFGYSSLAMATELCKQTISLPGNSLLQSANSTVGNPAHCPSATKWFPQLIDHTKTYNATNNTFLQQYQVVDTYYKPGGPIFFWQSVEEPYRCSEMTPIFDWAAELGSLVIGIEHRYFGNSCPYGLNYTDRASWDTKLLEPLSLDNVLMNGVTFVTYVKEVAYPAAKDGKVIMISGALFPINAVIPFLKFVLGSYGGILAELYRVHCSDIIFGALGSAASSKGLISDPNDDLVFGWADWVGT